MEIVGPKSKSYSLTSHAKYGFLIAVFGFESSQLVALSTSTLTKQQQLKDISVTQGKKNTWMQHSSYLYLTGSSLSILG